MALTEENKSEIVSLIKDYLNSNSITITNLKDDVVSEQGEIWIFGTQELNEEKKSVRINLSDIKGEIGQPGLARGEVSVYKESTTQPVTPSDTTVPPEGWELEQGSNGVWWVSKATFEINSNGGYGDMKSGWSTPIRVTPRDGSISKTKYRYCSSYSSINPPTLDDKDDLKTPGDKWKEKYVLVDNPRMGVEYVNNPEKPAEYNPHLEVSPVFLWETRALTLNDKEFLVPWSDPIMISAYGGSKGDTPILDPVLNLSANSGHMMCDPHTLDPLPNQNITITANPQNFGDGLKDAVFKMVSYKADGQPIDETSLSSTTATTAVLTSDDWLNTFARVEITCTVSNDDISRSASVIIHRQINAKPGENAMLAYFLPPFMNIPAHSDGTVPRPNYEEERSYFNLISGNEIIIDKNTSNSEIEFIFEGGKLGFEVAIVENGKWKSNIHGILSGTTEGDGTLRIINFPTGPDNMNIIVKAKYKDGSIRNGSASASFSLSKNKEPKEPDSPLDNSETKSFINMLTKGYVQPTLYIKPSYIESDTYQKDDYVPNKIVDEDNVSWTPSENPWHSKKQSVGPIWDHQWVSERTKTNGVWGAFDPPILRNNYPKPPIDTTEVLSVFLENESDNFYREGNSAEVFVRAFLGNATKTPTMIRVGDINELTGTYDDLFDFEINNNHQRITFTLNKNVNTRKNGKIPISTTVEGQDRVLYFRYNIIPSDSEGGGGGGFLMLSVSSNVMEANVDNSAKPGQVITIEAKTINVAGDVVFNTIAYNYNGEQSTGFGLEPTDVSSKKLIRSTDWGDDIEKVVIEASIPDTNLFDIQTIYKYSRTPGSITGHLTNPHITLYSDEDGLVSYFGSATGNFHVYDGGVRIDSGVTFSEVDKSEGYNVILNETTGHYSVDNMTVDNVTVTLRAIHESTSTVLDRLLTLRKSSDTIIMADSAYLKTAITSNTITRDVTSPSNHKDSHPKIIKVEAIHVNVGALKWSFQIDGAGNYVEGKPEGVTINDNGDILTITTEALTGVSTSLGIKVVATITGKDVELVDYENIQIIKTGQNLIPAKTPLISVWKIGDTHRNNIDYVDYIYYRDFNTEARNGWFKLTDEHSEYTAPASPYDDSENTNIITIGGLPVYEKIDDLGAKAFNLVIAEEANLAGFIFKNNILYSQKGLLTKDGVTTANLMLNGHDGEIKAVGGTISGNITATSGEIGDFTLEDGYLVGYDSRFNPARPTMGLNAKANINKERDDNLAFWAGESFDNVSRHVDNYHSPDPNFDLFDNKDVAYITHSGRAFFSKADIKGKITATSGTIGGFTLSDNSLIGYNNAKKPTMGLIANADNENSNGIAFWAGVPIDGNETKVATIIRHDGFAKFEYGEIGGFDIEGRKLTTYNAGLSGVEGINKDNPALWAGGTYEQAIGGTAKAIIRHDGSSKFTDTEITGTVNANDGSIGVLTVDTSGEVKLEDPDTEKTRLSFIKSKIPLLVDLLSTTNFENSTTAIGTGLPVPISGSSTSNLRGTLNVEKDGATINITGGAALNFEGSFGGASDASVIMSLYLMRNGSKYSKLQSVTIPQGTNIKNSTVYARTLTGMPSGNYSLMLEITKVGTGSVSGEGSVEHIPMSWSFQQSGIRNFLFGLNGFLSYFSDRHIYFSEEDGFDLKGKTNMPGVLLSTTVSTSGEFSNFWGAKRHASKEALVVSTGTYEIYHSIGHSAYNISANAYSNRTISIVSKSSDRCRIQIYDGTTTVNSKFDITLFGNNYK